MTDSQSDAAAAPKSAKRNYTALLGTIGILIGVAGVAAWKIQGGQQERAELATFIPTCDSEIARATAKNAVEQNVPQPGAILRVLDIQKISELKATKTERLCSAMLVLNNGDVETRYIVSRSSDGGVLVKVGDDLDIAIEVPAPQPSATVTPVASAPPATLAPELDMGAVSKLYPVALDRWRSALSALSLADNWNWARDFNGAGSVQPVELGGRRYIFVSFFPEHMGGIVAANLLFSEDQARVFGLLQDFDNTPDEIQVGSPDEAEIACLHHLVGDQSARTCN